MQGAGCAAWRLAEVEGEQVEGFPRLEGICVCVNGVEIESPKAGLVGDAWSVLYPVGIAVAVAEAVVAVGTAGLRTDRWARCFATAGHLVYWEMVAYGKMIELTSGRWKEIWWVNGGVRISKIASPSDLAGTHAVCLPLCVACARSAFVRRAGGVRSLRSEKDGAGPAEGLWDAELLLRSGLRQLLMYNESLSASRRLTKQSRSRTVTDRAPVLSARASRQPLTKDGRPRI